TGTTVNLTGLTGATNYVVYVRSICGASSGIWTSIPVSFQTACPIYNNFYEHFDTTTVGTTSIPSLPACWSFIDDVVSSGYVYTYDLSTGGPQSGSNYIRMYRTKS